LTRDETANRRDGIGILADDWLEANATIFIGYSVL
jgi:hypothetical protein